MTGMAKKLQSFRILHSGEAHLATVRSMTYGGGHDSQSWDLPLLDTEALEDLIEELEGLRQSFRERDCGSDQHRSPRTLRLGTCCERANAGRQEGAACCLLS